MEHESFEDAEIARLLNEHFVSIKVDREERPDLDQIYMTAVQLLTGQGGWPMSVFLTPDLQAVLRRHLLPARRSLRPAVVQAAADGARRGLARTAATRSTSRPARSPSTLQAATPPGAGRRRLERRAAAQRRGSCCAARSTARYGGFGRRRSFRTRWTCACCCAPGSASATTTPCTWSRITLDHMAIGGIYDHLGGGFHRYSTDAAGWCRTSRRCSTTTPC